MEIIEKYRVLNDSYIRICVFHIGIDAGFFCEYSYLIEIMMFCLENGIQLKLYSKDSNFGFKNGWCDYFLPFCKEVDDKFHSYVNFHKRQSLHSVWTFRHELESPTLKWKLKLDFYHLCGKVIKFFRNDIQYFSQDIRSKIQLLNKNYSFPELNFEGNYVESFKLLDSIVWRFNIETKNMIDKIISDLNLPEDYISCQIRGGDKYIEHCLHSVDIYLNRIKKMSNIRDVFVLTDDYSILQSLKDKEPNYNWYSLCESSEKGYYNRVFSKIDPVKKKERMIRFFASIELLKNSKLFLGTITSNPSRYIMCTNYDKSFFVDFCKSDFLCFFDMSREDVRKKIKTNF